MLIRLMSSQVGNFWKEIRQTAAESIAWPINEEDYANILNGLESGKLQAWLALSESEKLLGVLLTTVIEDIFLSKRSLLIYALKSFGPSKELDWETGLEGLKKFAKASGCSQIIAYTNNERLVKRSMNGLMGKVSAFVEFGVD